MCASVLCASACECVCLSVRECVFSEVLRVFLQMKHALMSLCLWVLLHVF